MNKILILFIFISFYAGALAGILACYITTDNRPLSFWEYLRYTLRRIEGEVFQDGGLAVDEDNINDTKKKSANSLH